MASVRQADTALWLHNKLSGDNPWSGSSLRSLLTPDVLRNIPECFHRLEPQVKIKLLMAFLHLPRRVLEETIAELGEILEIGAADEDEWVRVLCEILKYYPTTGMLNVHLEQACPVFAEVTEQVQATLAASDPSSTLMPLECPYLNKVALMSVVGQQPALPKHFTLRRKPKSAALRAELLQKAQEVFSAQKKANSSGPGGSSHKLQSPSKKFDAPLRVTTRPNPRVGSHGRQAASGAPHSRSIISAATLKHHGRTKLLDINEQPIGGGRELKRRKKFADGEQSDEPKQKKAAEASKPQEPATPDYAAGLQPIKTDTKTTPTSGASTATATPATPTPSYAVLSGHGVSAMPNPLPPAAPPQSSPDKLSESTLDLKRELESAVEQQRKLMMRERQQKQAAAAAAAMASLSSMSPTPPTAGTPPITSGVPTPTINLGSIHSGSHGQQAMAPGGSSLPPGGTSLPPGGTSLPGQMTPQQQQQLLQQQQKRQLTLSREQMLAAHEMFRNANRVSRAEKALILGFMAGARDKPFPHQGPIITIKLSENTETVQANDGTQQNLLVEMLFEMNYDTGHWRRLKRTRVISKQTGAGQS